MAKYDDRERFIPITKNELTDLLVNSSNIPEDDANKFRDFSKLLAAYYHFEYHENMENLKNLYDPFDPDADTISQKEITDEEKKEFFKKLVGEFGETCESANYCEMSDSELNEAFEGWSPFGLNLKLDLEEYESYSIYYRGSIEEVKMIRQLPKIWKQVPFKTKIYKRLAIMIKLKDTPKLKKKHDTDKVFVKLFKNVPALDLEMLFPTTKPAIKPLDRLMIFLPVIMGIGMLIWKLITSFMGGAEVNQTRYIKKYKDATKQEQQFMESKIANNIKDGNLFIDFEAEPVVDEDKPEAALPIKGTLKGEDAKYWFKNKLDLSVREFDKHWLDSELVTSNPEFKKDIDYEMHYFVKLKGDIGVAIMKGVFAGAIMGLIVLLGSWTFKSVMKFLKMKQKYVGTLAQNLFYLNLDNNFGVFSNLINSAEEEEWKEAAFAYFFLNTITDRTFTEDELDDFIETWVAENCKTLVLNEAGEQEERPIMIDFEIEDGIRKLEELELLTREKDGDRDIVKVLPWDQALERIDYLWDNFFEYNGE